MSHSLDTKFATTVLAATSMALAGCASGCGGSIREPGTTRGAVAVVSYPRELSAEPAGATGSPSGGAAPEKPASAPGGPVGTSPKPAAPAPPVPRPAIVQSPIPFGARRKAEMVAYAERHYGLHTYRLIDPKVIVIHYTETPDFQSTYNTFAPDVPDSELHELPGTCAHFVIDTGGTIRQLVPLGIMCRHTVGLNWTAIGIEHVGYSDAQVLDDRRQIAASLRLVRWLRCRFHIPVGEVIGHNESLQSPYHQENVVSLRTQTHSDFNHADMRVYRRRLRSLGGCPR